MCVSGTNRSLLPAVIFIEKGEALQQQIAVIFDRVAAHRQDEPRDAACGDDGRAAAKLGVDAVDHAVDHAGRAQHHAAAHGVDGVLADGLFRAFEADGGQLRCAGGESLRRDLRAGAAAAADVAIVCVGNHPYGTRADWKFSPVPSDGREAVDRKSLMLPDEDLVKLVLKANPNTILVLVSSFPYTINWSQEHVPAIVHITHCSQEQGNGLADVLFGKVNPAGRTVQTWVKDITDLPDIMDYDIRNGRTYMYHQGPVLYPFGYGLSYSDFTYEKIESVKQDKKNIRVTVSVKNTSGRDGEEVVQLYASYPDSKVERPSKQLRAFRRIPIKAGETRKVTLTVPKEELGYWNEGKQMFVVEPGTVKLLIGASSEDIRLEGKIRL